MSSPMTPPFSARNRGAHSQISNSFPDTARTALVHLLYKLVDDQFVRGWPEIARELRRIARKPPSIYDSSLVRSIAEARSDAEVIVGQLAWDKVFDFCERLHGHLATPVMGW